MVTGDSYRDKLYQNPLFNQVTSFNDSRAKLMKQPIYKFPVIIKFPMWLSPYARNSTQNMSIQPRIYSVIYQPVSNRSPTWSYLIFIPPLPEADNFSTKYFILPMLECSRSASEILLNASPDNIRASAVLQWHDITLCYHTPIIRLISQLMHDYLSCCCCCCIVVLRPR